MTTDRIGYIGPGIMGLAMIRNLRKADHDVKIYARRAEQRTKLKEEGLTLCSTPADVAAQSDIIFICVSDTPDVESVLFGENGIASSALAGTLVIDMSTISALTTREFAERLKTQDVELLDAPVSGGEQGAVAGTLSIMAGGSDAAFARARPLLELLGSNIVHVGPSGAGQTAKACNQVLVAQTITAVAEALTLAEAAGVDPAKVRSALMGGFAGSRILDIHGQRMLDDHYQPGFKTALHQKDMNIVRAMAKSLDLRLEGAELAAKHLDDLMEKGLGELDSAAIKKCFE